MILFWVPVFFPICPGAGLVGLPLSACPCSRHGSCVLGPSVAPVGKARVTFLPRLCTGELGQTLFVSWVCFHPLMVSLLPSFLDLSKPRNLKAKHHWSTIWFHIKTALARQSCARAWVSLAACNCTLSLAPAHSGGLVVFCNHNSSANTQKHEAQGQLSKTGESKPNNMEDFLDWNFYTFLCFLCLILWEYKPLPYLFKVIGQVLL